MMTRDQWKRASLPRLFREREVVNAHNKALTIEIKRRMLGPMNARTLRWLAASLRPDEVRSWGYTGPLPPRSP